MIQNGTTFSKKIDWFSSVTHTGGGGSSGGGGGGQNTVQTQKADPWSMQQGFLNSAAGGATDNQGNPATGVYNAAAGLYNNYTPDYFTGQIQGPSATVAQPSADTQASIQMAQQLANNPSPVQGAATNQLTDILNGKYLSSGNPAFQGMMDNLRSTITPQTNASFEAGNRYGSGARDYTTQSALANAGASLAYQNYNDAQNNISKDLLLAPQISQMPQNQVQMMGQAGAAQDAINQANITGNVNQFNWQQELPYNKLAQYAGIVQNGYPGGSSIGTTTQGTYSNPLAGALGGGILGGAAGYAMGGGYGAAAGAAGGGLLGGWFG